MIDTATVDKYWKKHDKLMKFGFKTGLIRGYGEDFLARLREVYYGGIPASILLLNPKSCGGKCYDRAVLACFAFEDVDYQVVHANVDSIRYNRKTVAEVNYWLEQGKEISSRYPNHCFVEFKLGNVTWVLDTTDGLVYEKHLYYLINNPEITCIRSKAETLEFPDYRDIANADFEKDKWIVPTLLPVIEQQIEDSSMYKELARREIQIFKDRINYDELCAMDAAEKEAFYASVENRNGASLKA